MAENVENMIAELNAFEPTDDVADNDERLQIWVDRWDVTPDKEQAVTAMFGLFERYPEFTLLGEHGEPGPMVHAIEEIPGYEQALAESLERVPSYYGVVMLKRLLDSEPPKDVKESWLAVLRNITQSETASPMVKGFAQEVIEFE